MGDPSQKERKPVNFERLALQSSVLAPGTIEFLKLVREHLDNKSAHIRKILDLGCAIGDETLLLAEHFPEAEIIAIDPMSDYITQAQSRVSNPNIHFRTLQTESAPLILQEGRDPDLIYCRMFLMHSSNPQTYLQELSRYLKQGVYLAIEEPDSSKIGSEQGSEELRRFVDILLRFGECREETYRLGPVLADILSKTGFDIEMKSKCHPKLVNDTEKQLIIRLATDLAPKFSAFDLAEPSELCTLNQNIANQITTGKLKTINYCEMTQILARWP